MSGVTHALVLCAGLGTRLHPLTLVRSKPAVPIGGEPLARRILAWLAGEGLTDAVVNLHHLPHTLARVLGDGSDLGIRVRYSWEQPRVLGSAGGPRQALDIVGVRRFLAVNGDVLTDPSLPDLERAHDASGALATLALVPNDRPEHYSGLLLADDGAIVGHVPKGSVTPSYHFTGVQIVEREVFEGVPPGAFASSVGDVYSRWIESRPGSIRAHVCEARFWDVGTPSDYWRTSRALAGSVGSPSGDFEMAASARVDDCIIWDRVRIGDGSRVHGCIVTDDVQVAPGSAYERAILIRGDDGGTVAVPFSPESN
ncbi:MAG: sugar phosphate nucleotidyltransferase [Vicinamibacterales bacterium]